MMRNQLLSQIAVAALALVCAPAAMLAQQADNSKSAESAPATLKVQAREVLLPVTVRDKKGGFVTTLDKADFTLTEDGRPQVIKSFVRETNLPYKLGLLVDTSRSVAGALENERKAGGDFVDAMLPAEARAKDPDEAFLIHFDREVELLQDLTTSREKLHHELDDMSATRQKVDDSQGPETTGDDRERTRNVRGGTQLDLGLIRGWPRRRVPPRACEGWGAAGSFVSHGGRPGRGRRTGTTPGGCAARPGRRGSR